MFSFLKKETKRKMSPLTGHIQRLLRTKCKPFGSSINIEKVRPKEIISYSMIFKPVPFDCLEY